MVAIDIPGVGNLELSALVLDVNGTLSLDGVLLPGVAERCRALSAALDIHLLTADTHGTAVGIAGELGVHWSHVRSGHEGEQKRAFVETLGAQRVVAIGNGNNDAEMLQAAALGIAVLGPEGTAARAVMAADVVAADILTALDLLLHPVRILATLRQ